MIWIRESQWAHHSEVSTCLMQKSPTILLMCFLRSRIPYCIQLLWLLRSPPSLWQFSVFIFHDLDLFKRVLPSYFTECSQIWIFLRSKCLNAVSHVKIHYRLARKLQKWLWWPSQDSRSGPTWSLIISGLNFGRLIKWGLLASPRSSCYFSLCN